MTILDTIMNSQGGQLAAKVADHFGIQPDQVQKTVQNLVPSLVDGVKNAASQSGGLQKLHELMQAGNYQQYVGNISQALSADGLASGKQALEQMLGGSDVINKITSRASAATGLATDKINEVLPVVSNMVMGVLHQVQQSPVAGLAESALNSPLGKMAGGLIGGAKGAAADPLAAVKSLLDAHPASGFADELKGMAGKFLGR
ncbi:MAG: DUF937 domain-containing protein [Stenotrophobium sp.]